MASWTRHSAHGVIAMQQLLLKRSRVAAETRKALHDRAPQADPPITRSLHLMLHEFELSVIAARREKAFAVTHLVPSLNTKPLSIRVRFQN